MPVVNRIADYADDMKTWRRWIHAHPELGLDCHGTAAYVVDRLKEFGVDEIHEGIATSGVVAVIRGQGDGPAIGLRADMDALPIVEETGVDYQSTREGKMHACGHDGHTTMLLGAARYLAETRKFSGSVVLLFQPAEETDGGGEMMVKEGVMERFGITQVYALHNAPGLEVGAFETRTGAFKAAVDTFEITVTGRGGHAARPHETCDPIVAAVSMVQAIQTIVSRNSASWDELVISVTQIHTGTTDNIVPESAYICGTVRTFEKDVQDMVRQRLAELISGQAASFGVEAELEYTIGYPATVNHANETDFAIEVASEIAGADKVDADAQREMGAEDFSYMLEVRPGAYLTIGQGDTAGLHHPKFDFDDEIAPIGASFFARLVERGQPLG